jgi:sigma-54 dependent transcriptional regulator, flagellar regulatory protein
VRIIAATHHDLEESIVKGTFRADLYYRLNVVPIDMPPLRDRAEDLPLLIADLAQRIGNAGRPQVKFASATVQALKAYHWPGNVRELGNLIERMSIQCGVRAVTIADLPARYRPPGWSAAADSDAAAAAGNQAAAELIASAPATCVLGPALEALSRDASAAQDEEPPSMDQHLADALLDEFPDEFDLRNHLESLEQRLIERAMRAANGTVAQAARLLGLRRTTLVEKLRKYSLTGSDTAASET